MGNSGDDGIPSWQRAPQSTSVASPGAAATQAASTDAGGDAGNPSADDKLAIARRFLDDEKVKNEPQDKKVAFLKAKGVEDVHIQELLGNAHAIATKNEDDASSPVPYKPTSAAAERAPIVTYPEFLAKPQRPPPLVTTQGLFNTVYGFVGLSTLIYGVSKYVVEPMVENLNNARQELHVTTASRLEELVNQLERTVSVVPPPKHAAPVTSPLASTTTAMVNDEEDDEDPAEMFHRDIGTQTSFSDAVASVPENAKHPEARQSVSLQHATGVTKLTKCVSSLRDGVVSQSGDFEDIKAQVEHFREELDRMIFPQMDFTPGTYGMIATAGSKNEPDDEVRKARDNIRRIKGVLLSTRSFPASTR
ncbi:peroxin Pex14/17-Penicillium chrysogenum [Cordyceps fumosorosea ARSEF 2679]|uniref:Peroxisomal membrane protein PEX14 n=1 Tax=Cordyceps fumosorosea (strain ARSEF 2679) TaxID=1081104 RepID=A0A167XK41_CORFA|nr:peroxin Pex14/17-Penicillium chrysogenum [Cordyceps fumosorosea ARSEF 2679]OAA65073.1 peroxin Pex14/17-Penicillium chrysogenum [Cordyceps fumosorosea ARSEF 2679]